MGGFYVGLDLWHPAPSGLVEQPRQSAMAHHVHRHAAVDAWVLISESW